MCCHESSFPKELLLSCPSISPVLASQRKRTIPRAGPGLEFHGDVVISAVRDKMGLSGLTPAEQSTRPSYDEFAAASGFCMENAL